MTKPRRILSDVWRDSLPGTKRQFLQFLGTPEVKVERANWKTFSKIGTDRIGLIPTGGGVRFAGTEREVFIFTMQSPRRRRYWREGVPVGGAWIDKAAADSTGFIGFGSTIDHAALSALLICWELTFLRAMQSTIAG